MAFGDKVRKMSFPEGTMEYHDLPSTKEGKDCWVSIEEQSIRYHYTSLKEDNLGCYIIESHLRY